MKKPHPPPPIPEILQRVRDDFHTIAHHRVNIDFLVLFCDCWQEENQPPLRLEHRTREKNQVRDELGQFIRFRWRDVRLITPGTKVRNEGTQREMDAQNPCVAMKTWTRSVTIARFPFLPSRFAPARTPSMRGDEQKRGVTTKFITYRVDLLQWHQTTRQPAKGVE